MEELEMIIKALDALDDIQKRLDNSKEDGNPCPACLTPVALVWKVPFERPIWRCTNCGRSFMVGFDFTRVMKSALRERRKNSEGT